MKKIKALILLPLLAAVLIDQGFAHSLRRDFTGLARAARIVWKLTVTSVIRMAAAAAAAKIHQLMPAL